MPNWCSNSITIETNNDELIAKLDTFFKQKEDFANIGFFSHLVPITDESDDSDIDAVARWGTKWDVRLGDFGHHHCNVVSFDHDENAGQGLSYSISFDTAWSPPLAFLTSLVQMYSNPLTNRIVKVSCEFYELGNDFYGLFENLICEEVGGGILGESSYSCMNFNSEEYTVSTLKDDVSHERFLEILEIVGLSEEDWDEYYANSDESEDESEDK